MALRTAIIMTPTSAKMAAHMFARPNAVSARQPNLTIEREHDVLLDDADALTGNFDGLCNLHRIIVHEDNVCGFDGGIAAHGAHGDADIGTGAAPAHR